MIRRTWTLLALTVSVLAGGCTIADIGPEYVEVSEEQSGLLFYGPGLAGGFRQFLAGHDQNYVRQTVATYGPKAGEFPFAQMFFSETPPDRHFARAPRVEESIEEWGWFRSRTIRVGAKGDAVNAIGRIDYAAATADAIACVVWIQTFGPREGGGVGTRLLSGFYCRGEGPMFSADEAESIVRLVGHRKYGVVEPPAGWWVAAALPAHSTESISRLIPVTVVWHNDSAGVDRFEAQMRFSQKGETGILKIDTTAGPACEGRVTYDRKTKDGFAMLWNLSCADGITANGELTIKTVRGTDYVYLVGQGEDSRGRKVAIVD